MYAQKDWEDIDNKIDVYKQIFLSDAEIIEKYNCINPEHISEIYRLAKNDFWAYLDINRYMQTHKNLNTEKKKLKKESEDATIELIDRFYPLFKKYLSIIKTGQINFSDISERLFMALFIGDKKLKLALYGKIPLDKEIKSAIYQRFNFIKETYGHLETEEIMLDLKMLFIGMMKRYKRTNRSFCCYVSNAFRYEVFRHIQKFNRNPLNIHYKNLQYEDCTKIKSPDVIDYDDMEDKIYKNALGLPDMTWIQGETCSDAFSSLTPLERKIISKYYLEHMCDRQIADYYGMHVNTCNAKRRKALNKLVKALGYQPSDVKHSRNSGKKALF